MDNGRSLVNDEIHGSVVFVIESLLTLEFQYLCLSSVDCKTSSLSTGLVLMKDGHGLSTTSPAPLCSSMDS